MNTKDDLNEESLDPFGYVPVTVGTTNIQTNMTPTAEQNPPVGTSKTKIAAEFQYAK